jgi:hypothetical protein
VGDGTGGDLPPAGWYDDPEQAGQQRFWDGTRWTDDRRPAGPPAPPPPHTGGGWGTPTPMAAATAGTAPNPWLWQSIVATLLCCLPAGIAGIVFATQSKSAADRGDHAEAQRKADLARTWTWVSVGLGVVLALILAGTGAFTTSGTSFR